MYHGNCLAISVYRKPVQQKLAAGNGNGNKSYVNLSFHLMPMGACIMYILYSLRFYSIEVKV